MSRAIGNLTARSRQGKIRADNPELANKLLADDTGNTAAGANTAKTAKTPDKLASSDNPSGEIKSPRKLDSNLGVRETPRTLASEPPDTGRDSRFTADSGRKSVKQVAFNLDTEKHADADVTGGRDTSERLAGQSGPTLDLRQSGRRSDTVGSMSSGATVADTGVTEPEQNGDGKHNVGEDGHVPGASVTWDSEEFPRDESPQDENGQSDKDTVTSSTTELGRLRSPSRKSLNLGEGETPPPSTPLTDRTEPDKREDNEEKERGDSPRAAENESEVVTKPAPSNSDKEPEQLEARQNSPAGNREKHQTPTEKEDESKDNKDGERESSTPTNQQSATEPNPTYSRASPQASRSSLSKQTPTPRSSVTSGVNPHLLKTSVEDKSLKLESSEHPRFTTPYSSQRLKPRGETAKRAQPNSSVELDKDSFAASEQNTTGSEPTDSLEAPSNNPQAFSVDSLEVKNASPDASGEPGAASSKPGEGTQETVLQTEENRTEPNPPSPSPEKPPPPSPPSAHQALSVEEHEKDLPAPRAVDGPPAQSPPADEQNQQADDSVEFVIKPDPNKTGASRYSSAQGSGRFSSRATPNPRRPSHEASNGSSADVESRHRYSGAEATPSGKRILYVESPTFTREEEEEYRYVSSRLENVEEEDPKLGTTPRGRGYALRRGRYTYSQPVAMAATHKQPRPGVGGGDQPAVTVALEKRVRYSDIDTVVNPGRYEDREVDRDVDRMIGAAFPVDARQGAYSQAGRHELMMEEEFPLSRFSVDTRGRRPGLPEEARVPPQPRHDSLADSQGSQALRNVMAGRDGERYDEDRRPREYVNTHYPPGERYPPNRNGPDNAAPASVPHAANVKPDPRGQHAGYSQGTAGYEAQQSSQPVPRGMPQQQLQQQPQYQPPPPHLQQQQRPPIDSQQHYQQRDGYSQYAQDQNYQQQRMPQPPQQQQQQYQQQQQQQYQRQPEDHQLQPPPQPPRVKSLELPTGPSYDPADEADLERETTYQQSLRTRIEEVKRQTEETNIPRLPLAGEYEGHPGQGHPQGRPRYVPGSQDFAPDSLEFYQDRDGGETLRALEEAFGGGGGGGGYPAQRPTNHFRGSDSQFGAAPPDSNRDSYYNGGQFGGGIPEQRQPQSRLDNVNFESDDFGDDGYEDFRHPRRNPQVQPRFFNPELAAAVANSGSNNNYSNNASGGSGGGGNPQQHYPHHQPITDRSDFDSYDDRYRDENVNENGGGYDSGRGGGGGRGRGGGRIGGGVGGGRGRHVPDEDEDMEASHPKPPKYDYVSQNKEDYGKAPPKSYQQISVINKEEKEKLNGVFIQPKPKGGILKKRRGRGGGGQGPGTGDTSRQESLCSGDGSYLDDDQLPDGEAEEVLSAAEQVWARRSSQLAGNQQGGRGKRGGRGGHVPRAPGGLQKHHSDSSINQISYGPKRDSNNDRQHHHHQHAPQQHSQYQHSPQQHSQQQQQQQQRQVGSDKRAFMTDLPTPVNEQLSNQVTLPVSSRQGEIHLQPIHQQIITEDGQRISVDVNLRLVSPPPQSQSSPNHHPQYQQQQQQQQQQQYRRRQYPTAPQYNEEEEDLLDDHGGYSDYTAGDPLLATSDYRYISPRERYSADEVLRALSESRTELNPYGKVPPIDGGRGRGYRDDDHPSSAPIIDQGGSYMDVYMRQRDKEADKPWYKVYGLKDYRKMVKEVRLGTLGPDLDSDATRERREKAQRQQDYAKVVMEKNRTELVNKKPPAFPRPKENNDIMNRRRVAQEYAKSVPKPTVRVRPNEYNNYEIASEKSPIAKHHRKVTSSVSSPMVEASATPSGSKPSQSPQHANRPGGKEKEMEVLDLERLRQRYEQDKQNEAAIRQTSGRLY